VLDGTAAGSSIFSLRVGVLRGDPQALKRLGEPRWLRSAAVTSQRYGPILARKLTSNSMARAADLVFRTVGVAGFEPTASSS
jgi:hypothetical protein